MVSPNYKRDSYNGFGEGLSRAFELAATPAIFGAVGYFIDRRVGSTPAFMIGFLVFAVVGMFVRMYFGYTAEMDAHEQKNVWAKSASPSAPVAQTPRPVDDWSVTVPSSLSELSATQTPVTQTSSTDA